MADILVIDDDSEVLGTVQRALSRDDHEIRIAESPAQARALLSYQRPHLIILDIMMPGQDGLSFCKELRANPMYDEVPILFLSARWRTDEIVQGLDAGGDDYISKPFELKELTARVRALLRRYPQHKSSNEPLVVGDISLDPTTCQVSTKVLHDRQLTLTEFRLLHHLMSVPNHAHSIRELLDRVWQYPPGTGDPDLVRAHIRNLRAKLEDDPGSPQHIHTIHGVGYMVRS